AIRSDDEHHPVTRLVSIENTQNRSGGRVLTREYTKQVADLAHQNGLVLHIDGARIFNAAAAQNLSVIELTRHADSVSFCLSKGLGAPVGSVLCGSKAFIHRARRRRKMLGGGMRQGGVLAAAGIYALEHHVDRLREDHDNARALAEGIARIPGLRVDVANVQSNMVYFDLTDELPFDAIELCKRARSRGVKIFDVAERTIRAVTHCWVSRNEINTTIQVLTEAAKP
ncbi:MAG TPA: GntG family PLP-dependent aldolase, partial [Anaerolineae bacterium]